MQKYIPFVLAAILMIVTGCQKNDNNDNITPQIIPSVSFNNITYSSFGNSTWQHAAGGIVLLEFDLKDAKDSVSSRIKDSLDLKNISSYKKVLTGGKYDINISTRNQTSMADTFIRFKAQVKSYAVNNQQAVSLNATTTDGLITIAQSFIKDNTVPVFKADIDSKSYKLGLINGFYYIYVKGSIKGSISFISKATNQLVNKTLDIQALNHYNLAVQVNKNQAEIVFSPFAYNQVSVTTSTLLNLNLSPGAYVGYTTYFVVTDETGKILNEVKYISGTTTFKISALEPYEKDRFNFFQIKISDDIHTVPGIVGFLQIKKGSTYTSNYPLEAQKPQTFPLRVHLKNASVFDKLTISTDGASATLNTLADTSNIQNLFYSDDSKIWVQVLKNNQLFYKFFDIAKGTHDYDVDINKLTSIPLLKTITPPGENFSVNVLAKADKSYGMFYNFGGEYKQYGPVDYYYPAESLQEYDTYMYYSIGNFYYANKTSGTSIPDHAASFSSTFTNTGLTLANFKPSYSGSFDFYSAHFENDPSYMNLSVDLFSPFAANYTNVKLPDFSKYLGVKAIDMNKILLKHFELDQVSGFKENNSFNHFNYPSFLSVSRNY